jgi:hypothetical protein
VANARQVMDALDLAHHELAFAADEQEFIAADLTQFFGEDATGDQVRRVARREGERDR